jgi:hypothetical protein
MMRFKIPCVFFVMLLLCGGTWHRSLHAVSEKAKESKKQKGEFKGDARGRAMKEQYDKDNSKLHQLNLKMKEARQRAQNAWIEAKRLAADFKHKFSDAPGERMYRSLQQTITQMKADFQKPIDDAKVKKALETVDNLD